MHKNRGTGLEKRKKQKKQVKFFGLSLSDDYWSSGETDNHRTHESRLSFENIYVIMQKTSHNREWRVGSESTGGIH